MLDLHRRAMSQSVEIVGRIRDDQWDLPTPCAEWTLRELLEHMVLENRGFAAAAGGEISDSSSWTTRIFDADLRADYVRSAAQVVAAFGAGGVLERTFWLPLIDETARFAAGQAISFHLLDYLVHGWDVAAAIGHPVAFDTDLVRAVRQIADREVPDGPRRLRPDASFRPALPGPVAASEQDLLLAVLGRSPGWPG